MKKSAQVANFNVVFGENERPMLDYFDSIIYPALTSGITKTLDGNEFLFKNIEISSQYLDKYVLTGKLVKKTILEIKSDLDEDGELVEKDEKYSSAPYSSFAINLLNHRMMFMPNQKGSPSLANFRSTVKHVIKEYVNRQNSELDQDKKLEYALINVVGIPTVFLSKENMDTLDDELQKNYNMELKDLGKTSTAEKHTYKVRVMPPERTIRMKRIWHEYSLVEKGYSQPIDYEISSIDMSKYDSIMYEKESLRLNMATKEKVLDTSDSQMKFSEFTLVGEVARYLNLSCLIVSRIIREAKDGVPVILDAVNKHNEILYDVVIPKTFHALYEVKGTQKSEDVDMVLLREPKDAGYYEFSAKDELVVSKDSRVFTPAEIKKSFHADTYCFDSKPELECFKQYISSDKVKEVYFTGMFTSNQGDLSVHYYDPESKRVRQYYPDFLALMKDETYQLIEVKGDHMIDNEVVLAKKEAAEEMSIASGMRYLIYASSILMKQNVLQDPGFCQTYFVQGENGEEYELNVERGRIYNE